MKNASIINQNILWIYCLLGQLRSELLTNFKHFYGMVQCKKFKDAKHLKLHVGCGKKKKEGWINIDLSRVADITLDMRKSLPLSDFCCSFIYSEHFLEHLKYPGDVLFFLGECFRVLEPGGIFSAGVPDTEWPLLDYAAKKMDGYFLFTQEKCKFPEWCETEMEYINYHFRQDGEHQFAYDFKTLDKVLKKAGFKNIRKRDFDQNLDSIDRRIGTLYVNAVKV